MLKPAINLCCTARSHALAIWHRYAPLRSGSARRPNALRASQHKHELPLDNYFFHFHVAHMFGIIAVGDKQYKIVPGEACVMEKIDAEEGADVSLKGLVLLANDGEVVVDKNSLENYTVSGQVVKQFREDKVIAYKKKRRQGYERKRGHRQYKTLVLIKEIKL